MRDFVVELRKQLVPEVRNLTVPGMHDGSSAAGALEESPVRREPEALCRRPLEAGPTACGPARRPPRRWPCPADPDDAPDTRPAIGRFCSIFPDAFFVSERARVYLDPKEDKRNAGRLLSAGFHSMTGYFRDDAPLFELILDERVGASLTASGTSSISSPDAPHAAVLELPLVRAHRVPVHAGRRVRLRPGRGQRRDLRGDDQRLAEVYLAKARSGQRQRAALEAIDDYFAIISAQHPPGRARPAGGRAAAISMPPGVRRAGLSPAAVDERTRRDRRRSIAPCAKDGLEPRGRRPRHGRQHPDVAPLLLPGRSARAGEGVAAAVGLRLASRLSYFLWSSMPDEELLAHAAAGDLHRPEVLVAQARRMLRDDRVRGAGHRVRRQLARLPPVRGAQQRRPRAVPDASTTSCGGRCSRSRSGSSSTSSARTARCSTSSTPITRSSTRSSPGTTACPSRRLGPTSGSRVDDARRYGRGGLLPMAVFLTKNSPGLRTSPVKRGYWVVRRLLGENIPAPPPERPRAAQRRSQARRADASRRLLGPAPRRQELRGLPRSGSTRSAWPSKGYGPVGELRDDRPRRPAGGHPRRRSPAAARGRGSTALRTLP